MTRGEEPGPSPDAERAKVAQTETLIAAFGIKYAQNLDHVTGRPRLSHDEDPLALVSARAVAIELASRIPTLPLAQFAEVENRLTRITEGLGRLAPQIQLQVGHVRGLLAVATEVAQKNGTFKGGRKPSPRGDQS